MDMYAENVLCKINNVEFSGRDNPMGGFKMHHDALYNEIATMMQASKPSTGAMGRFAARLVHLDGQRPNHR